MSNLRIHIILTSLLICTGATAQLTQQWAAGYNGKGDFTDKFNCMITDENGFVYAAGSTTQPGQNSDYLIVKLSSSGAPLWRKAFNAPGNGPDEAKAIALDNSGHVLVTGFGNNINIGNDFWTMVLNTSTGDTIWTKLYNDATYNQYDQANSIAVDPDGNVLVTGESDRDVTGNVNDDFLTVKYSTTGVVLWTKRFNGTGNATDRSARVLTDDAGNVYVTGRSNNGGDDDYATIKYEPVNGVQQWIRFYDSGGIDRATDMGIDGTGNIYVTGRGSNGADDDFYTIKYSGAGNVLLSAVFDNVDDDRAEAITVNPDGSFAITGRSDGNPNALVNWNYYTVKYSTTGIQSWTAVYNGPANNDDWATDIAMNSQGSVAVTGYSDSDASVNVSNNMVTILYNTSGAVSWTKVYGTTGKEDSGSAVAFLPDNTVCSAGFASFGAEGKNATILFYPTNGSEIVFNDNGLGDNTENIRDMVVDDAGNVYVCGYSVGPDTDRDMLTMKLNSSGDTLWTRRWTGTMFGSDEEANAIALDPAGNVIVSGYTKNSTTGSDITIIKYTTNGLQQWLINYDGLAHESDRSYDMELDATGNVYITGRTDLDPLFTTNDECFTAKYLSNGTLAWTATYSGFGAGTDRGKYIHVTSGGGVYVVGRIEDGDDQQILVIKYDSGSGAQQWAKRFDSTDKSDEPTDFYLDASENSYICGYRQSSPEIADQDYLILKYDNSGVLLWNAAYDGPAGGPDQAQGITVDTEANVYVTGSSDQTAGDLIDLDAVTLRYSPDGNFLWAHTYNAPQNLDDISDDVGIDNMGNVFVIAHSNTGDALDVNYDLHTYSITEDGTSGISATYSESDSSDVGNVIFLKGSSLYVGGSTWKAGEQRNMLVLKYDYTVGVNELGSGSTPGIYPNPFRNQFTLEIPSHTEQGGMLGISDLSGRLVHREALNFSGRKTIQLAFLTPGTYLAHFQIDQTFYSVPIIKIP